VFSGRGLARAASAAIIVLFAACDKQSPTAPCTDCTPPVDNVAITCPSDVTATAPTFSSASMPVPYPNPTVTGGTPPVTSTCSPASNSSFSVGKTTVTCTAVDSINRQAVCSFGVTVQLPPAPKLQVTSFMAFGDSLTAGDNGINEVPGYIDTGFEYPTYLQDMLVARYQPQTPRVVNRGQNAETAYEGSQRLPGELDSNRPDALLLMEGVNEFFGLSGSYRQNGPPVVANVKQYLRWDIEQAKGRNVKVFLSTLPPEILGRSRAWLVNGDMDLLALMNDEIRNLAGEQNVWLVDGFKALNTNPSLYIEDDGLHMTRDGRQTLAQAFLASIQEHLEIPSTALPLKGKWKPIIVRR
jgi:lysophospholipase L1-like esterase